jgi:hypothetical protein
MHLILLFKIQALKILAFFFLDILYKCSFTQKLREVVGGGTPSPYQNLFLSFFLSFFLSSMIFFYLFAPSDCRCPEASVGSEVLSDIKRNSFCSSSG